MQFGQISTVAPLGHPRMAGGTGDDKKGKRNRKKAKQIKQHNKIN
jgi:hypothetical protein